MYYFCLVQNLEAICMYVPCIQEKAVCLAAVAYIAMANSQSHMNECHSSCLPWEWCKCI